MFAVDAAISVSASASARPPVDTTERDAAGRSGEIQAGESVGLGDELTAVAGDVVTVKLSTEVPIGLAAAEFVAGAGDRDRWRCPP